MAELFVEQIKSKNWSRHWKRTKGLRNTAEWGYWSRGRGSGGTSKNTNQAADDIRKMFAEEDEK